MPKNFGVVKWFGSGDKNYGFITILSGNGNPDDKKDIFFHRAETNPAYIIYKGERLPVYPHEGNFVSFDIVKTAKGLKAVNVTVLNAQALANETDFADEAGYRNFREKLLSAKAGKKFLGEFIAAVPEENFRKYPWLREELSRQKRLELCLEIYAETPTPELENEMAEILPRIATEKKFQIPPELAVKKIFREHSDIESKRVAAEKYFDTLTVEEIADLTKDFSPEEIIETIKDKLTFSEKLPALAKIFVAQTSELDDWARIIFAHNLPLEIIRPRLNELNRENELAAVEKYFDTLTVEEIADLTEDFSPEEIIETIKDKLTFSEKLPAIIEKSFDDKFSWACYFIDNVELFRQTKIGEDVLIFFMYESINRWNGQLSNLSALIKLLNEKIDDINASPRAKIIYCYICAAFAKHYAKQRENRGDTVRRDEYLSKRDEFINDAEKVFTEIFNRLTGQIKSKAENPDEDNLDEAFKNFFGAEAQLLPSCRELPDNRNCVFCEAVTWNKKVVDADDKESFKLQSWCPRGERAEICSRLFPNSELPAKDWSVVELMAKLHLLLCEYRPEDSPKERKYKEKVNREFFTRLGGEFNRIKDLLERLKCRKCGKYMRAVKGLATWKEITNLRRTAYGDHFAIFATTTFSCQNDTCSEKGKPVYLSYCWHCGEVIDSRDNHVRIKGFYLCNKCGAGYRDYVGTDNYTIFPGTICPSCTKCPKCGGQEFNTIETADRKFQLQCTKCEHVMNATLTIKASSKNGINVKGECSLCGHNLEWNQKKFKTYNLKSIPWQ